MRNKFHKDIYCTVHQRSDDAFNSFGESQLDETVFTRQWANVRPVGGREIENADTTEADLTHTVYMHSDLKTRGITTKMFITYDNSELGTGGASERSLHHLEIVSIHDVENANMDLVLKCRELQ